MKTITWYNKNFRFVFSPYPIIIIEKGLYVETLFNDKSRFLIGAGSLDKYIKKKNAETVLKRAQKMKTDKITLKFRKYGKIEIYNK